MLILCTRVLAAALLLSLAGCDSSPSLGATPPPPADTTGTTEPPPQTPPQTPPPQAPPPEEPGPENVGCDGQTYPALDDTPYVLPFPVGTAYRMNLGNCSALYHAPDQPDRYAYDFGMDVGTPITAARAGTVVHVVESGVGRERNNLVVVVHDDRTFAQYMHLVQDGALVDVGDTVRQGDPIGLSGATGLAGYPHLHFVVTRGAWPWPYDPVPVSFTNVDPRDVVLQTGLTYSARPYVPD